MARCSLLMIACSSSINVSTYPAAARCRVQQPISVLSFPAAPTLTFKVVNAYPHDRAAFTEGLVIDGGALYEGTGLNGQSSLRRVDLESGKVLQNVALGQEYFGEGVTVWGDQIIQLTWKSRLGFVYDKATFQAAQDVQLSQRRLGS